MNYELEFIKRVLTDTIYNEDVRINFFERGIIPRDEEIKKLIEKEVEFNRLEGLDWPERAHTMIGIKRLNSLHQCLDSVRENNIPGDFIETGVWRGGASIFMKYYNDHYKMGRRVFVADSFRGLPKPNIDKYPQDIGDTHHTIKILNVSLEEVSQNFSLYRVLDQNVIFLEGWFEDTLKDNNEIKDLSILRFDGDMYGSTMDVLNNLYPKLQRNGYLIIDDYCLPNCVKAVQDFREKNKIHTEINLIDKCGIFWIKN